LALIDRLQDINGQIDQMIARNNAIGYVQTNLEFHRTLYLRAQAPAMLAMLETVWLQLGPTMSALYVRLRRKQAGDNHRKIIAALRAGDEPSLRLSIRADVTQGLQMLVT
jgi:DNA-binding GntR family transcriptional regulator